MTKIRRKSYDIHFHIVDIIINKQYNRYWDDQNPHWIFTKNNQTVWGINVWCGLIGGKLLEPNFLQWDIKWATIFRIFNK